MTDDPENFEHALSDLMAAEQRVEHDKQITQISFMQGQNMALLAILHRKGILTKEDLWEIEDLAVEMQSRLQALFALKELEQSEVDEEEAEVITRAGMEAAIFLAEHLPVRDGLEKLQNMMGGLDES